MRNIRENCENAERVRPLVTNGKATVVEKFVKIYVKCV
jgi:hypothetical protein